MFLRLRRAYVLALLLGCGPDPAADRAAFRALDCGAVGDARLADECLVFAVSGEPERADLLCPTVTTDFLRDECWFLAVDRRELVGDAAARGCARTGRYVPACHANAVSREVSRLPPMPGPQLRLEVERILATFHRPAWQAGDIVARRLAAVGDGTSETTPP